MEAQIGSMIEQYLTRCGKVFVSAQYDAAFDKAAGAPFPDIVALDFGCNPREVVVVEITAGSNVASVLGKVRTRKARWFDPLMASLRSNGVVDETWRVRFLGFVREANLEKARTAFTGESDVWFHAIEKAVFPFEYGDDRLAKGLPRSPDDGMSEFRLRLPDLGRRG